MTKKEQLHREAIEVEKCKISDWSCMYHACMSDDCQKRFMLADVKRFGPGKCKIRLYDYLQGDIVENSRTGEQYEVLNPAHTEGIVQMKDLYTGEVALNDGKLLHYKLVKM